MLLVNPVEQLGNSSTPKVQRSISLAYRSLRCCHELMIVLKKSQLRGAVERSTFWSSVPLKGSINLMCISVYRTHYFHTDESMLIPSQLIVCPMAMSALEGRDPLNLFGQIGTIQRQMTS